MECTAIPDRAAQDDHRDVWRQRGPGKRKKKQRQSLSHVGQVEYRLANESDIPAIIAFVDFWLAGRGLADGIPGSAHDYFVPAGRHLKFVTKYTTLIALVENSIVGWAVKTHQGVLIHLLVAGTFRHQGIGRKMLELMDPDTIRSKMDQSAGDPADFYHKHGYTRSPNPPQGKKHNIELFTKARG